MMTNTTAIDLHMTARLFERAYSGGWWAMVRRWLGQDTPQLQALDTVAGTGTVHSSRSEGLRVVPIAQIVGSESRVKDFDGAFHPLNRRMEERWCGIAMASLRGDEMPPVALIRIGETYFVRDGHHRISVAAHLGRQEIEAVVTAWEFPDAPVRTSEPENGIRRHPTRQAVNMACSN